MSSIEPLGNMARHLNTLAALISGIAGSGGANLPRIAQKNLALLPSGLCPDSNPESRVKRFQRWLKKDGTASFIAPTVAISACSNST
jgi:hypothetical protein